MMVFALVAMVRAPIDYTVTAEPLLGDEGFVYLLPGDNLAVPGPAGVTHVGIYAGNRMVVHNSKQHGRVVEESLDVFAAGADIKVVARAAEGWGPEVVRRARAYLGQAYNLLFFNCEHLVSLAMEGEAKSPALRAVLGLLALFGLVGAAAYDQRGWDPAVGRHRDSAGRFRRTWL